MKYFFFPAPWSDDLRHPVASEKQLVTEGCFLSSSFFLYCNGCWPLRWVLSWCPSMTWQKLAAQPINYTLCLGVANFVKNSRTNSKAQSSWANWMLVGSVDDIVTFFNADFTPIRWKSHLNIIVTFCEINTAPYTNVEFAPDGSDW